MQKRWVSSCIPSKICCTLVEWGRGCGGRRGCIVRAGNGIPPYQEHHARGELRPSFQVFDDDQRWYCYAWERGGDLFDFLCLYHHLTPKEAWALLQQGRLL